MAKTVKQIADELGVSKQAVFKKIKREPLSTSLQGLTSTVDGRLTVSVDGEKLIKQAFLKNNRKQVDESSTSTVDGRLTVSVDSEKLIKQAFLKNNRKQVDDSSTSTVDGRLTVSVDSEIEFLRSQVVKLQAELEKEREHNRQKDRQLLDVMSRLAESQAALSIGQAVDKRKALAETMMTAENKTKQKCFLLRLFRKHT